MFKFYSTYSSDVDPKFTLQEIEIKQIGQQENVSIDKWGSDEFPVVSLMFDKYSALVRATESIYNSIFLIKNSRFAYLETSEKTFKIRITEINDFDFANNTIEFEFYDVDSKHLFFHQNGDDKETTHTKVSLTLRDDINGQSEGDVINFYTNAGILRDMTDPEKDISTETGFDINFHTDIAKTAKVRLYFTETQKNNFLTYIHTSDVTITPFVDSVAGTSLVSLDYDKEIEISEIDNNIYSVTLSVLTNVFSTNNY